MVILNKILHFWFIAIIFLTTTGGGDMRSMQPQAPVKGAYWPSWKESEFSPSNINTTFYTHIYYAFLVPDNITNKFEISDSTAELLSNFTTTLRHKTPPVKTLISFGGGGSDEVTKLLALIASDSKLSETFIISSFEVARKFGFDGLDPDWESPSSPKEMKDLARLLKQWRKAIKKEAKATNQPPLLLTAAVYFSVDFFLDDVYRSFPTGSIRRNLDWINVMAYDYHGAWDPSMTGALAALYDKSTNVSTSHGLRSWIRAGVPPGKICMGLPLYGRTWTLKDPNSHGIGSAAILAGPGDGLLTYSEVVEFNNKYNATVLYDIDSVSTYSFVGSSWIGYDDPISTTIKIGFAQALGLRGYFFWALSFEKDFEISTYASRAWVMTE
ncbi:class V chitinase CHIT5b-like [Rutidosis leptorrhynchoides]|uniref:class V chitinase CHIT5b-like n=1 Tax=Rutidosis leptorrhynchoides TaxID=125765 RepID=UPI003A99B956